MENFIIGVGYWLKKLPTVFVIEGYAKMYA